METVFTDWFEFWQSTEIETVVSTWTFVNISVNSFSIYESEKMFLLKETVFLDWFEFWRGTEIETVVRTWTFVNISVNSFSVYESDKMFR